jgi:hypothetical protein
MDQSNVIFSYTWQEALDDGVLYRLWRDDLVLPPGKPVLATIGVYTEIDDAERRALFAQYLAWKANVEPTLPEEERMFVATARNGKTVWVIDDGSVVTLLYPDEY